MDESRLKDLLRDCFNDLAISMFLPGVHAQDAIEDCIGRINNNIKWADLSNDDQ